MNDIVITNKNTNTLEVYLYGAIGRWMEVDAYRLVQSLKDKEDDYDNLAFYVNSDGGQVDHGIAIFNYLRRSSYNITFYIDGIAASMAAIIVMVPEAKVYIAKYARLMLHRVSGCVCGNADDVRDYVEVMEDFEADLINIVAERTGLSDQEVKEKYFDGKDHWVNSKSALKTKLVDGQVDGRKGVKPPKGMNDPRAVYDHYQTQIINSKDAIHGVSTKNQNQNNNKMENTQRFINLLSNAGQSLPTDASEDAIYNAVKSAIEAHDSIKAEKEKLEADRKKLQGQLDSINKDKVKNLLDTAEADKRISKDERADWEELANTNYGLAAKQLDKLKPHQTIAGQLGQAQEDDERKNWSFADYQKKDPKALADMRENNPDRYKQLYNKQYK